MKLALYSVILLFVGLPAYADVGVLHGMAVNQQGIGFRAQVQIFRAGTTNKATLCRDQLCNFGLGNPFQSMPNGQFVAYVDSGLYDVQVSGVGVTLYTYRELVNDPTLYQVNPVMFSSTPTFDLQLGTVQRIILTGDVTSITLAHPVTGKLYALEICQDPIGNHQFNVGTTIKGFAPVGLTASTCYIRVFYYNRLIPEYRATSGSFQGLASAPANKVLRFIDSEGVQHLDNMFQSVTSDPGCTVSGDVWKVWPDTTTTTYVLKICMSINGVIGWRAIAIN